MNRNLLPSALLIFAAVCCALPAWSQEKEVLGWQEKVRLFPSDLVIHAKLDTGADYSSLDASNITVFKKSGQKWVRFTITNRYSKEAVIERPLRRIALIKRAEGKTQKREVVLLGLCVGTSYMEEEINLINRINFSNQMLIGRSFLAGKVLVDPAVTYTSEPNCQPPVVQKKSEEEEAPKAGE